MVDLSATKKKLLASIDVISFYRRYFPKWDGRSNVSCPWHKDKNPSFNINPQTGQCYCHSAGCPEKRFASVVHFFERYHKLDEERAVRRLCKKYGVEAEEETSISLSAKHVLFWNRNLKVNASVQRALLDLRGLNADTIAEYLVGYDPSTERVTLPCFDKGHKLINVRRYNFMRSGSTSNRPKMIPLPNALGGNSKALYPEWKIRKSDKEIFLFGGELDTLLARQHGYNAVSSTVGEGFWSDAWLTFFRGKVVWICLDWDEAGNNAARKIKQRLTSNGVEAYRVIAPFSRPQIHKDFTDWVVKEGHNPDRFRDYLKTTTVKGSVPDATPPQSVALDQALDVQWLDKNIRTHCLVAGKSEAPYIIPNRFIVSCTGKGKSCAVCCAENAEVEVSFNPSDRILLTFINSTDRQMRKLVCGIAEASPACSPTIKAVGHLNLHQVYVIPDTNYMDGNYVLRESYFTGANLETNNAYELTGKLVTHPKTQQAVLFTHTAQSSRSSVENFKLTPKVEKMLRQFQPWANTLEAVKAKLMDIANDHMECRTRIIDREDLHLITMLTYHSALYYRFNGDNQRGWISSLVLGDTATGKTEVTQKLRELYHAGEKVSAENCSYVGLVGGVVPGPNKQYIARWGKIPLNDRRLTMVEEASALSPSDISRMTDVRSSGIAHIDKGGVSLQTKCRTRTLFLSNTRDGKNLNEYPSGVEAIAHLVGAMEDIRRFDLILTLRNSEVDVRRITEMGRRPRREPKYSDKACRALLAWAWSLKDGDVVFSKQAEELCCVWGQKMGGRYHSKIPIFKAEDGRFKIAKVAAAIANHMFSYQDGKVVVQICHVQAACWLLNMLYTKESMSYLNYSRLQRAMDVLGNEQVLVEQFRLIDEKFYQNTIGTLLNSSYITVEDFTGCSGLEDYEARRFISTLRRENALRNEKGSGWAITPQMRVWLQQRYKPT